MKRNGTFQGVAFTALICAIGASAAAADKAPTVSKEQRQKGMAAAPGLVTAGGLDCQVADARLIGQGKDQKTKEATTLYELACTGNEGLIVQQTGAQPLQAFTCAQANEPGPDGKPSATQCILPGNSDPKAGLVPYIRKAGTGCIPEKIRALGQSPTNVVFEIACQGGAGYILEVSAPPRLDKPATMEPCIGYPTDGNVSCKLTDRTAQLAVVDKLVTASGKSCTVKNRGYVGATPSGMLIYEAACADGKGFMLEANADGSLKAAIDCAAADAIGGGCKLTDARQAKTDQDALYTKFAAKAGFQCQVSGYAPLPSNLRGKEVVEISCANRPDGAIGIFGASLSDPAVVYDCAHSEIEGYRCALTKASAAYPTLTADLRKLGKSSCQVSNSRIVGVTAEQHAYVEVACADGLQGYMIEYVVNPLTPKSTLVCTEAKGISGGCTLPGNTK
ncbi:MAG: hypothetical protein ABI056_00785 [Caulobacteraceae bacterium]